MDEEQTQTQDQGAEFVPPEQGATRDDLIAAVREAGGTAGVDVAAEEQAAAAQQEAQQQPETPAASPPAEEEPKIARILREREKAAAEREAARNQAQELLEQARRESERLLQEAREKAQREWQEELSRHRQAFRSDPTGAIRQLGDPQEIIDATLAANTPEARERARIAAELAETKQLAKTATEAKQEIEQLRKQVADYAQQELVAKVKAEFTGQYATREKTPYAYAEFGGADGVYDVANQKAIEWQRKGLQLGVDFDFADVAAYVEREARQKLEAKLKAVGLTPAQQVSAGAPATGPGNAPKVTANGPRTLSAAQGSERRTSPRPISEMSAEEARQALIDEVAAARRANPNAEF